MLSAASACEKLQLPPKPNPAQVRKAHIEQAPDDSVERRNLLNIARGAAVVSRTAEMSLENSALRTIDGDPTSDWFTPTGDTQQTITYSLAARSRIVSVGVSSSPKFPAKTVLFETSLDGKQFTQLTSLPLDVRAGDQMINVPPVEASYVRMTTAESYGVNLDLRVVHAQGAELEQPARRSIDGCWAINTFPAAFTERGASAYGWFDQRERMWLQGGFDGRVWRFLWIRGPQFGLVALTMPPDSSHLSGLKWFEDADPYKIGDSLFGDRRECAEPQSPGPDVLTTFLDRQHWAPLYGLRFDDANQLVVNESEAALKELAKLIATRPVRLVSREMRGATALADRQVSQLRLNSLKVELTRRHVDLSRVTYAALGRDQFRTAVWSEIMRTLQSAIEVEDNRARGPQ